MDTPKIERRKRRSPSSALLRVIRERDRTATTTLGGLLASLGDRSFGWALLLFSLVNLLPLPLGSTLVTALPLLLLSAQLAMGYPYLRLPRFLAQRRIDEAALRRTVIRLRPISRPVERLVRPRMIWLFHGRNERLLGLALFVIAFTLFLPIPLSGWFPAISLLVSGFGLIERDGLISAFGLVLGAVSVLVTLAVVMTVSAGARAVIG